MEKAVLNITRFQSADVIATSGGGYDPIPTGLEMIWLNRQSLLNYNAIKSNDWNLEEPDWTDPDSLCGYYAFSGRVKPKLSTQAETRTWKIADESDDAPDELNLFEVGINDTVGYNRVLDWLNLNMK